MVLDFINAFGFVPLHVLRPAMRINVSINMLFGIAECYARESASAMRITSGATRLLPELARIAFYRLPRVETIAKALPTYRLAPQSRGAVGFADQARRNNPFLRRFSRARVKAFAKLPGRIQGFHRPVRRSPMEKSGDT